MNKTSTSLTGFVLHARPYHESSQLIQIFSIEQGRLTILAKGIKGKRSQARKALLQPFNQLLMETQGKSELKVLTRCELLPLTIPDETFSNGKEKSNEVYLSSYENNQAFTLKLSGNHLACGFYANELIMRACAQGQEFNQLYQDYLIFIARLKQLTIGEPQQKDGALPPILRRFELALLSSIGISPDFTLDIEHNDILEDEYYQLKLESGFKRVETDQKEIQQERALHKLKQKTYHLDSRVNEPTIEYRQQQKIIFSGQMIRAIANDCYLPEFNKASQQLTAILLAPVIGDKPLQSRKLWQHLDLK